MGDCLLSYDVALHCEQQDAVSRQGGKGMMVFICDACLTVTKGSKGEFSGLESWTEAENAGPVVFDLLLCPVDVSPRTTPSTQ